MQPEITWLKSAIIGYSYFSSWIVRIINQWSYISKMEELKVNIWRVMMWECKNNKNTTETAKKIWSVYDKGVIIDHQVENWFSKFHSGNTSLRNEPRPGHSSDLNQNALRKLVECIPHKSMQEIALDHYTSPSTVCHHSKKTGKVSQLGVRILHTLSEKNKKDYIFITTSLLLRQGNDPFLKNIITDDEKWVFYDNVQCKKQWIDKDESLVYPKGGALSKKSYAMSIVGSLQYYLFWVFKLLSHTLCRLMHSIVATCARKS